MDPDPDATNVLLQLLLLAALTLINAFFSGAEMALVSVNRNRITMLSEEGDKKAKMILRLLEEPTRFLSTIQVAITLSGFFASASAATGISGQMAVLLKKWSVPYTQEISFVVVTILLSYFTLVYGELIPKRIALQKAETFSMVSVPVVLAVSKIAAPFIRLLTASTNLFLKIIGMKAENLEEQISREEIRSMVEMGKEQGVFNEIEQDMINSIIEFDNKLAREIMTPRISVFAIDISEPKQEYLKELLETRYSRIPVYEEEIDNIIGVLHVKDLLREASRVGFEEIDIRSILHEPYLVPETKNIDDLFRKMQRERKYFAILINEYGEFAGVVTIEDLVEEVMGDIEDEYVKSGPRIEKLDEDNYLLDGLVSLDELGDRLDRELESPNFDTVSGFIIEKLGYIPKEDEKPEIAWDNLVFRILSVKEKRIDKLRVRVIRPESQEEDSTGE